MAEQLNGGRPGIVREGTRVFRPAGPWSEAVHRLLAYVRSNGFLGVPEPIGFNDHGQEIVGYLPGVVGNYPLSEVVKSNEALRSAGALLRGYHDATVGFISAEDESAPWMLPPRADAEVVCHGDFAPYNVVLEGSRAVGIIDFDTAHPASRVWDIAYALYRWAPFTDSTNPDGFGNLASQIERARLFCNSYGLSAESRMGLVSSMTERLVTLIDFMSSQAQAGDEAYAANVADGHHRLYLNDLAYIESSRSQIESGLALA